MAFQGKLILLLARDAVLFGDQLAGVAHVKVFVLVPEAVRDHRVNDFAVADAVAGARLRQQVGAIGHGFHAAGNNDLRFFQAHGLVGERNGFKFAWANRSFVLFNSGMISLAWMLPNPADAVLPPDLGDEPNEDRLAQLGGRK